MDASTVKQDVRLASEQSSQLPNESSVNASSVENEAQEREVQPETAGALIEFSECMKRFGIDSREVKEFLSGHQHLPEFTELAEESRRLETLFRSRKEADPTAHAYVADAVPESTFHSGIWNQRRSRWPTALAASVLLVCSTLAWFEWHGRPASNQFDVRPAWGWLKPGAFPTTGSAQSCYGRLADELAEWNELHPHTRAEMAQSLAELRYACTLLQFAELPPLPSRARSELRAWCRAWSLSLSDDLADLESDQTADPRAVYERANGRVQQMISILRKQSLASA